MAQGGDSPYCSFHPRELVVGVCAHCLRDRLLLLLAASAANNNNNRKEEDELPLSSRFRRRTSSISFPKFEDNGKATWDKQQALTAAPVPVVRSSSSSSTAVVAVVEHVKRGGVTRWRKQVVGRLLQLARWKRSAAAVVGMDGKKAAAAAAAERSKARGGRGWIRSITRRRHGDRAWS
ncbi:hypothetical protein PR202_gb13826 [Eleusine coracana subsp. coracana]|uniref:Uncharacterized protein n=1 Tax=Eleusine coracana subsp. coracana TaxID=191504 RepID=A0AAV5ET07_ELECO|nr:hypothetical protein PR202_gb13826 [Eleusine coracana subsp. coracana]